MNLLKNSSTNFQTTKNQYTPIKNFSLGSLTDQKLKQLTNKIGQPFISYKDKNQQTNQLNIAGYKTTGPLVNKNKKNNSSALLEGSISKQSIQKYLFTFCFEIGCDLPSQQQLKIILFLLVTHSNLQNRSNSQILVNYEDQQLQNGKNGLQKYQKGGFNGSSNDYKMNVKNYRWSEQKDKQKINKVSLNLLIKLCMQLYIQSKKTSIGGIIERLIIGIRKQIEQDQQQQDQFKERI